MAIVPIVGSARVIDAAGSIVRAFGLGEGIEQVAAEAAERDTAPSGDPALAELAGGTAEGWRHPYHLHAQVRIFDFACWYSASEMSPWSLSWVSLPSSSAWVGICAVFLT